METVRNVLYWIVVLMMRLCDMVMKVNWRVGHKPYYALEEIADNFVLNGKTKWMRKRRMRWAKGEVIYVRMCRTPLGKTGFMMEPSTDPRLMKICEQLIEDDWWPDDWMWYERAGGGSKDPEIAVQQLGRAIEWEVNNNKHPNVA